MFQNLNSNLNFNDGPCMSKGTRTMVYCLQKEERERDAQIERERRTERERDAQSERERDTCTVRGKERESRGEFENGL